MEGRVYVLPLGGSTRKVVFWKVSSSSREDRVRREMSFHYDLDGPAHLDPTYTGTGIYYRSIY